MNTPIIDKVVEQLKDLPQELQWRVLEFTRTLAISTPKGVPGQQLLRFSGIISPDDAQRMLPSTMFLALTAVGPYEEPQTHGE